MKTNKLITTLVIALVILTGLVLAITCIYSTKQLEILKKQPSYISSEEAMFELILNQYFDIDGIEIIHSSREVFGDLHFVKANVWAEDRKKIVEMVADGINNLNHYVPIHPHLCVRV